MKRYYALNAYGLPGYPFPKFWDNYPTLTLARSAANQAIKDGWRMVEIYRDAPRKVDAVGVNRDLIETIGH